MITVTHLVDAHASGSNFTSYTTSSVSWAANSLILFSVQSVKNGTGVSAIPTVSGGLTFTRINNQAFATGGTNSPGEICIFRALPSSSGSGAFTVDFAGESTTESNYSFDQFSSVNLGGSNGSNAIIQSGTNTAAANSPISVVLNTFANVNNIAFGAEGGNGDLPPTKGGSFTQLTSVLTQEFMTEYAVNVPTVNFTTANNQGGHGMVALEIAIGTGNTLFMGGGL
jgi:hypothetical protein